MSQGDGPSRLPGASRHEDGPWNVALMHRTTPARMAPPAPEGSPIEGLDEAKGDGDDDDD